MAYILFHMTNMFMTLCFYQDNAPVINTSTFTFAIVVMLTVIEMNQTQTRMSLLYSTVTPFPSPKILPLHN